MGDSTSDILPGERQAAHYWTELSWREWEILAVGRLSRLHGLPDAEFAILVRNDYQNSQSV